MPPGQTLGWRDWTTSVSWVRCITTLKCQAGLDAGIQDPMSAVSPKRIFFFFWGRYWCALFWLQCVGHGTGKGNVECLSVNLQSPLSGVSNLHFLPIHQLRLPSFQCSSTKYQKTASDCLCCLPPCVSAFSVKSCERVLQSVWGCLCAHDTAWLAASGDHHLKTTHYNSETFLGEEFMQYLMAICLASAKYIDC